MLLLSAPRTITVDGVTVFPDHADPNQFWYLPGPVSLARGTDGQAVFTFIKYKPAAVEGGAKGGGFAMFATSLKLNAATDRRIRSQLSGIAPGEPVLSLVPFDTGTVKCIALNLEGSGGTSATAAHPGAFNAVEEILGATTPSLQGDEDAAFSLTLSQEGATILEQAYKQGTGPIGVIYDLKFTGLRPALDVKIHADFKRIYDGLSASLSGQYYFVKATLEAAFEKLVQDGAIIINVTNYTTDQDKSDKEKWALDFFKQDLLSKWFDATLSPGQPKVSPPESAGLPDPLGAVKSLAGGDKTKGTDTSTTGSDSSKGKAPDGGKTTGTDTSKGTTSTGTAADTGSSSKGTADPGKGKDSGSVTSHPVSPQSPTGTTTGTGAATALAPAPAHLPATLAIVSRQPDPSPSGYAILHTPSASGLTETIAVNGGATAPRVKVDGTERQLTASRQLTIEVAPEAHHDITVEYPAGERASETFDLLFEYDRPAGQDFSTSKPPKGAYNQYLLNTTNDHPFLRSKAPSGDSNSRGAQALRDWINSLPDPKVVELDAHASWEGHEDTAHQQYNLALSNRRLQVAMGIIGDNVEKKVVGSGATGDQEAHAAHRVSTPGGTADNPDRVVHIKSFTGPGEPAATITARISRPKDPATPATPSTPGTPTTPSTPTTPGKPSTPSTPATPSTPDKPAKPDQPKASGDDQIAGSPAVAFKLRFVHQEEKKTMDFEYHRSDATQRTYAPQGFFGLMLGDLDDEQKHFVEVDLDDPFFREFAVAVQAPIDFQKIGLQSSHVSLDYGDPQDPVNHKHGDAIFDPTRPKEFKFAVFMNASHDTSYTYSTEFHFDPNSGWDGRTFSYQFPPRTTEDRNLFLNPYDQIGFLEVQVLPHQIDPGVIDSIDVDLSHTDLGGEVVARRLNVTPGSQPQFWRVRIDDPHARGYTYQLTHHLKDGTVKQAAPVTTRATVLPVNDPFDRAIEIDFVPMLNPAVTKMVFIDVEYDDAANGYHRQERLLLQGNAQNPVHLRIALMDPVKTTYRYRLTFVGTHNQMKQGTFVETTETLIAVPDTP